MTSVCISTCLNDARDPRVPVRATYVNLYKWPESDAEFVRSVSSNSLRSGGGDGGGGSGSHSGSFRAFRHEPPRVVDSISCRQMYLRSYPFSKEEDYVNEKTCKCCFGKRKNRQHGTKKKKKKKRSSSSSTNEGKNNKSRCVGFRRVKELSWDAVFRIFHKLLSCSASVDVVD